MLCTSTSKFRVMIISRLYFLHQNQSPEGLRDLQKRVAVVHAEAVLKYIATLPCPKEQKIELVSTIKNSFKA